MTSKKRSNVVWACISVLRMLAVVLAFFSLCNEVYHHLGHGLDPQVWWFDLGQVPSWIRRIAVASLTIHLFLFSVVLMRKKSILISLLVSVSMFVGIAGANTVWYSILRSTHVLHKAPLVPFSLCVFVFLLSVMVAALYQYRYPERIVPMSRRSSRVLLYVGTVTIAFFSVPCAQIFTYGRTDYRRPADVAVVFGTHTYRNGQPSARLASRVRRACELYLAGQVRMLIMSGGPGDGAVHETEAMQTLAMQLGVRKEDILTDREGLNTHKTVENTIPMFRARGLKTIIAVSDFSHVPRIKLAYALAGQPVYTVPSENVSSRGVLLFQLARETAALWTYYLEGLLSVFVSPIDSSMPSR